MSQRSTVRVPALALVLLGAAGAAHAGEWRWNVTPYAWATDIGVDVRIDDRQVVDETIPVHDLLDDLDTIVQVRVEAQHGTHGVMFDVFDVTLSDEASGVELPQGAGTATLRSDVGMTIFDLAGFYDRKADQQGFVFLYGTRVLNQRGTIDGTFDLSMGSTVEQGYEMNETLVDVLAGVRYSHRFATHWSWQMQADVSTGGTDYTWSAGPSLSYAFGKSDRYAVSGGYRHMKIAYKESGALDSTMTLSGFTLGFRVSF